MYKTHSSVKTTTFETIGQMEQGQENCKANKIVHKNRLTMSLSFSCLF